MSRQRPLATFADEQVAGVPGHRDEETPKIAEVNQPEGSHPLEEVRDEAGTEAAKELPDGKNTAGSAVLLKEIERPERIRASDLAADERSPGLFGPGIRRGLRLALRLRPGRIGDDEREALVREAMALAEEVAMLAAVRKIAVPEWRKLRALALLRLRDVAGSTPSSRDRYRLNAVTRQPTVVFVAEDGRSLGPKGLGDARKRIWNRNLATVVIEVRGDEALPARKLKKAGERLWLSDARPDGPFSAQDVATADLPRRVPKWFATRYGLSLPWRRAGRIV